MRYMSADADIQALIVCSRASVTCWPICKERPSSDGFDNVTDAGLEPLAVPISASTAYRFPSVSIMPLLEAHWLYLLIAVRALLSHIPPSVVH